ncbi:MAG: ABC transporter substrate-binding protein [Ramlibacter sp.]|nr:ABC transporter substrate-binding protein [Ramlibacter sp.]
MNPRTWALATSLCLALSATHPCSAQTPAKTSQPEKILRYSFPVAETGFDPAQISDLYSAIVLANIFEAPYEYDYLARPAKVKPNLAEAMPEVSADFRTFTFRLRQGIYFVDDPAFGGKKREVTAADFVYSLKRYYDPKHKSPRWSGIAEDKILGLDELRKKAEATGKFDYDSEAEGLRALDRYTVQIKLGETRPRFVLGLADPSVLGIMAREVVEMYGDRIMEHPVGTGPFMLQEWKRSSKITLARNPGFREKLYQAEPPADDAKAQAIAARMKDRRLPMVDKVVVTIIDEQQPRWLSFLNNEQDFMERLQENFALQAVPNNKLAPNLAKRGIQVEQVPLSDITMMYFNMTHPVVGGYTPDKVALRRAVSLAINSEEEVRLARRGQAVVSQGFVMPNTASFDSKFRTEMGTFDRARAIALFDLFGYTDKDGDGWRDLPDGKPLVLEYDTLGTSDYRERDEIVKKNLDAVGIKIVYKIGKWPEQLRASRAGKLMMWGYGYSAGSPDSGSVLQLGYSKSAGQQNHSRFKNARFDELYEKQGLMRDGPERDAVIRDAVRILVAYMPIKVRVSRIGTDLMQPWLVGYKRHPFAREFWSYVDIDTPKLPR